MGYLIELDVNEYGSLSGGEDLLPVDVIEHDWYTPYPSVAPLMSFEWAEGGSGVQPNVFWHPEIRDWVCDERSREVLTRIAGNDVHTFARGQLGARELFLVQAVALLDVVDRDASVTETHDTYEVLHFPAFRRASADAISTRIFRVPGLHTGVFVGETVKRALEEAGGSGMQFVGVDWV